jgi:hypothetical protein
MFFWMRAAIPPLWENHQNIKGGSYSLCVGAADSIDIFHRYTLDVCLDQQQAKKMQFRELQLAQRKDFT